MLKFKITTNLNKTDSTITFNAYELDTKEILNKKICYIYNYNFSVGNTYKCNIEKEDDYYIYIKDIEQIGIDINIKDEYDKKLKNLIESEDLDIYLNLNEVEDIKKEITNKKIQNIVIEAYNKNNLIKLLNNNFIMLNENEKYKINNVIKEFGNIDITKMFINKPYKLIYYFVERIFLNLKDIKIIKKNQMKYCKIIFMLKTEEIKGHTFTFINKIKEKIKNNNLMEQLKFLEKESLIVLENNKVYLYNTYLSEKVLIDNLNKRIKLGKDDKLNKKEYEIISKTINNSTIKLNNRQIHSIYSAIKSNITIINGKAGTGKSTIIKYIVLAIKNINPNNKIEIISLSGKAVNVIDTKINNLIEPKTIHRLFNFNGNNYSTAKKINELDYLIIDEMSMLDLNLISKILELVPLETKIIFCGDLGQIPPIGVGNPIEDMLKSKKIKNIELLINNRQGNNLIAKNSIKILDFNKNLEYRNDEFELINKDDKSFTVLKNKVQALVKQGYNLNDIMIITHSNCLSNKINNTIKELVAKEYRYKNFFTIGDKVIQTKNNYDKKVYNGEIGQVIEITEFIETEVKVKFANKVIVYSANEIKELDFAYCITINKSQGSQSKIVILYISENDEKYLNTNVVYTAITRAEEKCIIISKEEVLNNVICKLPEEKNTGVLEKILKIS